MKLIDLLDVENKIKDIISKDQLKSVLKLITKYGASRYLYGYEEGFHDGKNFKSVCSDHDVEKESDTNKKISKKKIIKNGK